MAKQYVGETGINLIFDCGVLVGSTAFQYIKYKKPDGSTTGTWTASVYSSYSEIAGAIGTYFIRRITTSSDFNQPGEWRFQTFVGAVDGTWLGETVNLTIFDEFQ